MFKGIGRFVVRHPWWTIFTWVVVAAALVSLAPKVETSNEQSDFLPSKYESVKAFEAQDKAFPQAKGETALIVATRKDGAKLDDGDQEKIKALATGLNDEKIKTVRSVTADPVSPNGKVQTATVQLTSSDYGNDDIKNAVEHVRDGIKDTDTTGLNVRVTGTAATNVDATESFEESDKITLMATVIVIFVLLLLTFRSILAALMPIFTVVLVMMVAGATISFVQKGFDLTADPTTTSMLPIVLFGVGTDYILFLLFRYRERLRAGEDKKEAMVTSVHRVGEVIASAAGAVIIAFSALLFAQLGMLRTMGPSMAIAVAVALVASLTLVPAIVSLIGPKVFWPSKAWKVAPKHKISGKIGAAMSRRPWAFAVMSLLILGAFAVGVFSFKPSFEMASAPKGTESYQGMEDMKKGFPPGAFDATQILLRSTDGHEISEDEVNEFRGKLDGVTGVGNVKPFSPEFSRNADGDVAVVEVELANNPQSSEAMEHIKDDVRPAAHDAAPANTEVLVGGTTAIFVDLDESMNRDYRVVFPIAGVLIAIILAVLLRSLVAPLYLLIAVVLSFAATIGASVLVFQVVKDHAGLLFFMPLVVYLFVVALGTDYNILAIARLREEARAGKTPGEAAVTAFTHVAPTVASAGLILAGSFATFLLASADAMQEMGVSVAMGIALSAFVMSMFLVPAITKLLGHAAWWPGHQDMPTHKDEKKEFAHAGAGAESK